MLDDRLRAPFLSEPLITTRADADPDDTGTSIVYARSALAAAILLEVGGTVCMRLVTSWPSELWRIPAYLAYAASFSLFPIILRFIPMSVAYATWSACGTAAIAIIGSAWFHDVVRWWQVIALVGISACVVLLHV
jgi:small multidrug resistance pump